MTDESQVQFGYESSRIFNLIKEVSDDVGQTATLIEDQSLRNNLIKILDTLSQVDKNLTADVLVGSFKKLTFTTSIFKIRMNSYKILGI